MSLATETGGFFVVPGFQRSLRGAVHSTMRMARVERTKRERTSETLVRSLFVRSTLAIRIVEWTAPRSDR